MSIFDRITPPDASLFFKKNDPNDIKLGETVLYQQADYQRASVVLIGLPQDEGVRRNGGRVGAKDAPDAIRRCLYKTVIIAEGIFFDIGNSKIFPSLEETHENHQAVIEQLIADDKTVIVLGGGNDTSYPDCAGLAKHTDVLAFNVDAHFDVRTDQPRNSGTPYRQLLEEAHISPNSFYEIAYQPFANSPTYIAYLKSRGVTHYALRHVHEIGLVYLLKMSLNEHPRKAVFWGLDMDVVCASDAPGVSAINPYGLTGEEVASIGTLAGQHPNTRIFEITEVNPTYDIDDRTCRLAAATIWNFLSAYTTE